MNDEEDRGTAPGHFTGDDRTTVAFLKERVSGFVSERSWEPYHTPRNLACSLCIEAAELLEIFQWEDVGVGDTLTNRHLKERIEDETADILIYLLSMANALDLDLTGAVSRKMEKNRAKYPLRIDGMDGEE